MITLDTSAIVASIDRRDPDHGAVVEVLRAEAPPYLVPAAVLGEVACFIEARLGQRVMDAFLGDLSEGAFSLECGDGDLSRTRQLVDRYADLPLGFVDASVIACAERSGYKALTLDLRDFSIVARDVPLTLLPES